MLSAGVKILEKDLTLTVPNVSGSVGGIAGRFSEGPIGVPVLVSSEDELKTTFGSPNDVNFPEWFAAAEFLKYSGAMYVVRAEAPGAMNAYSKDNPTNPVLIKSQEAFDEAVSQGSFTRANHGMWMAKRPGATGNSIGVVAVDAGNWAEFEAWALNNVSKFGENLSKRFSQPPKTSAWIEDKLAVGEGASFTVTVANDGISSVSVTSGGSGYSSKSYIEFNGKGTGAAGTLTVENGVITKIDITNQGSGYTTATASIVPGAGGGSGATLDVTLSGGKIVAIDVTDGGSGYTDTATVSFTGDGADASAVVGKITNGVITAVTVTAKGIGYGSASATAKAYNNLANDELHLIVLDTTGKISGAANSVLEVFEGLSKIADARSTKNTDNYYMSVVNTTSNYIYWIAAPTTADQDIVSTGNATLDWGVSSDSVIADLNSDKSFEVFKTVGSTNFTVKSLYDGNDGESGGNPAYADDGAIKDAYSVLADVDLYNIVAFPTAAFSTDVIKHVVENVAASRGDAMATVSPYSVSESVPSTGKFVLLKDPDAIVKFKQVDLAIADQYAQYGVMDSGWKYIFDKYNNKYRWVPMNGDVAGLIARMETVSEPWFSPGGPDRGGIKNAIKLFYNPSQAHRDVLYPKGVNPVVILPGGGGTMLYGDKTMTSKPSAFDRINVRRLFSILEKSIGIMAKYKLFEINDNFTRTDFKTKVEAYLRNVQGRRGITDFFVVCDTTNNTGDVIDRNEFVASIFVKPSRSINFVTLNFVATSTGVAFDTVIGA